MSEPRLGDELLRRFTRVTWITLTGYVVFVVAAFWLFAEINLRRSLDRSGDVVESLIGLYADPEGSPTAAAPEMLAERLVGMGGSFVITRMIEDEGTMTRRVYFLTPDMPALELTGFGDKSSADDIRARLRETVAERGGWRFHLMHRQTGDFDIFVAADRGTYLPFLGAMAAVGLLLLPVAGLAARRGARGAVTAALEPLHRVARQTRGIQPQELDRRLDAATGQAEITELAGEINRMLGRVEQAQRSLEKFTADASHELRTPLTYLRAQAQWAQDERRSPDDMRNALLGIESELQRTSKLVEDMLLIAKMENRQLAVTNECFDLQPVLQEVEEIACAMVLGREVVVAADVRESVWVTGDPDRTRQILLNLATNAARHTASGHIRFAARPNGPKIGITVSDSGEGIDPAAIEHIFDRFYRAEASRSREHGGAGLGLTIARLLAELQEGALTVESTPGTGTTFTLWLPAGLDPVH